MESVTFKLQEDILKKIDNLLIPLNFNNRTEFIRDAIRDKLHKIELEQLVGIIPNKANTVQEIRELRKKLSKKVKSFEDLEEINKLID